MPSHVVLELKALAAGSSSHVSGEETKAKRGSSLTQGHIAGRWQRRNSQAEFTSLSPEPVLLTSSVILSLNLKLNTAGALSRESLWFSSSSLECGCSLDVRGGGPEMGISRQLCGCVCGPALGRYFTDGGSGSL